MSEFDKLAAALVAFQGEVPVIPKNRTAKIPTKTGGSYSYKFADLSDMWDAIREPLRRNGLAVTQPLTAASVGCMAIKTTIWHESGQAESETFEFPVVGRSPQEIGSLITYMKRYALGAALGISTDDDDDGNAATHRAEPKQAPKSPADAARDALRKLATVNKQDLGKLAARFKNDYGLDLKEADAETVIGFTKIVSEEIAVDKAAAGE